MASPESTSMRLAWARTRWIKPLVAMLATGVTTCLPTIITASANDLAQRLAALDRAVAQSRLGRIMVPGYHLEGPFLNPADGYAGEVLQVGLQDIVHRRQ
jgi:hypothetical protein